MKLIRQLTLALLGAAALLMSSCNEADEVFSGGKAGTPLTISVAVDDFGRQDITTRSTIDGYQTTFEAGDAIGIWAYESATAKYSNKKWILQGNGTWLPDTDADNIYYHGSTMTIKGYYPYDALASTIIPDAATFEVKADQSTFAGYKASDLLLGSQSWNGAPTALTLQFTHAMALVEMKPSTKGAHLQNVTLNTLRKAGGTAGTVTFYPMTDTNSNPDGTYRALLPAQTLSAGAVLVYTNGDEYLYNLNNKTLTAGKYHSYSMTNFPKELTINDIEMVHIPAGAFMMGSPATEPDRASNETQHQVTLTKDFYMGKYLITFDQYDAFCDATNRNKPFSDGWGRGSRPVINVSWHEAVAFCDWITQTTGMKCQLPTEAQWEYTCRAGTNTAYSYGDVANGDYMWYINNSGNKTNEVGTKKANPWGLYDMHGNVSEWCSDWYDSEYGSANAGNAVTDPTGADTGTRRVDRGGDWNDQPQRCRSAFRNHLPPDMGIFFIGFRVSVVP